ncbi:DUF6731 family protein [Phenylobacterium sp.]|uniref:DUF6731 family protein n=1 Tax=Phenylobacterium sp. TaxID=1871053 RepID=UPI002811E2A7|nr:DUF6731 family protein [Phenylobacterium sp.]
MTKPERGVSDFPDILTEVIAKPNPGARELELGEGVVARLERCKEDGDYLEGEFCRIQTQNIPPETGPDGLKPIKLEGGLGHVAAYLYHRPTRVLLLQRNIHSVTAGRLALYLAATNANRIFGFAPVLAKNAMDRFLAKEPRGFAVTFAGPENLEALDDANIAAAQGAKLIAEAYGGVRVKIEVTVGKSRKKFLRKQEILEDIGGLIDVDGVKALKVNAAGGGEDDMINFMKEQLQGEQVLDLPEGEPDKNYEVRRLFLRKVFSDNMKAINKQFG